MSRLDNYLVESGICESRNRAQAIIKEGLVSINGEQTIKTSYIVKADDAVKVKEHEEFVSRSALKLSAFLDELTLELSGAVALDIGASTGGFTQVLLKHGVKEVSAVDVGHGQLHHSLKSDPRVLSYEGCDIRNFKSDKKFDIAVSDVAFISLLHIIPAINALDISKVILLFKPQFEVGREARRDKNGVVKDDKAIVSAMVKFEDACALLGWRLLQKSPSKLSGKDGNLEYCYYFKIK